MNEVVQIYGFIFACQETKHVIQQVLPLQKRDSTIKIIEVTNWLNFIIFVKSLLLPHIVL